MWVHGHFIPALPDSCFYPTESKEEARDQEIEEEREKEREFERKATLLSPKEEVIENFNHPHLLTYTESDYKRFICNVCNSKGAGKRYHCAQCNFDLHKICAQSPIVWLVQQIPQEIERLRVIHNVIRTFAHPQHSVIAAYKQKIFTCDHCKNVGGGLRYCCDACNVMLHQVCAENPTRLTSHLHPQHELELKLRPHLKYCERCGTKGSHKNNRMYICKYCEFYMHPQCSQLPMYLVHLLHPPHLLLLQKSCDSYRCSACSELGSGSKYSCTQCGLDFDLTCIMEKLKIGLNDEVRQKYADDKITLLPVANLTSS